MGAAVMGKQFWSSLCAAAVLSAVLASVPSPAFAAEGDIVISEIHYHPVADPDETNNLDDNEFLELHNPGDSAVDLTGYTFGPSADPAIRLDQPLSGSLAAGAYAIVAPSGANTEARWGIAPIGTYTGKLSNGGELIELLANDGSIVDQVEWDDAAPWPGTPDGDGPSLELVDVTTDNAIAANWAPSDGEPTPGAPSSTGPEDAGQIAEVTAAPTRPAPNQTVNIAATSALDQLDLVYLVGFGEEQTVSMTESGPDTFTASVPGQAAGQLIRYRLTSPTTDDAVPDGSDGRRWLGVVVNDPSVTTTTSGLVEWFIPEPDYDQMFDNPLEEIKVGGSVLVVNGTVYDNIEIKIRGGNYSRENNDKLGLSVDLPSGVTMLEPDLVPYPVDEFALGTELGFTYGRQLLSWSLFEQAGFPTVNAKHVRVQRNGEFYGIFRLSEKLDNRWREASGITGDFYKAVPDGFHDAENGFEKKQGDDDLSPIIALGDLINQQSGQAKTNDFYDNLDIPNVVNFLAVSYIIGHYDTYSHNFYVQEDLERTGLWQLYPWDLSDTFGVGTCDDGGFDFSCVQNPLWDAFVEIPEFEQMVYRRIRTLLDGPFGNGRPESLASDFYPTVSPAEMAIDDAAWETVAYYSTPEDIDQFINERRTIFESNDLVPASQSEQPTIVINEIQYDPADGGVEYLELFNPTSEIVDLSGWTLDGVGLEIGGGTMVMPGGYVVLTESIPDFQRAYPNLPNTVLAQFDGGLKKAGEQLTLLDPNGLVIDEVSYQPTSPWPTGPAGNGPSLELRDPSSDNSAAASWGASTAASGTPGAPNAPEPPPPFPTTPASDQIVRLYQAIFGREPERAGLSYWLDQYQSGMSLARIAEAMTGTPEFQDRYGANPSEAELVDALYLNVLGRPGDASGREYWIDQLETGSLTSVQVVMAFADSPENISRTETDQPFSSQQSQVLRLYRTVFGRTPDWGGFNFWVEQRAGGMSLTEIASEFALSAEFQERYGSDLTDAELVDALYQNVLGRAGEPTGRDYWLAQLGSGALSRIQVLVSFSESKENIVGTGTAP